MVDMPSNQTLLISMNADLTYTLDKNVNYFSQLSIQVKNKSPELKKWVNI